MAENKLIIDLIIEDKQGLAKLKSALGSIKTESKKTTDSLNADWAKVAGTLASVYAAYRTVSGVVGGAIREATQQEDAINRLNFALKSQGTFTEAYSKALQGLSAEFQRTTKFTDDSVESVIQSLVTLGNVAPKDIQKVTQATLDFATATKIDLSTAGELMAKAAQGQTAALSRYGIVIDKNIPKSEQFAELQRLIADRMGGAAQNDLNSFSGSVAMVGKAWNDMLEELGGIIINSPVIREAIKGVADDLATFGSWIVSNKENISGFIEQIWEIGEAYANYALALAKIAGLNRESQAGFQREGGALDSALGFGETDISKLQESLDAEKEIIVEAKRQTTEEANQAIAEAEALFKEEQSANKLTEAEEEVLRTIENETRKIDVMREMWNAWNNEKLSTQMIQNQHESEQYQFMLDTMQQANQSFWKVAGTLRDQFSAGISSMLSQAIRGTVSWGDAFKELGLSMVDTLIKFGVQLVVNKALASGLQAAFAAESAAVGAATASAWSPAALFVSLATFGANAAGAISGITATAGALATSAAIKAFGGIAGLAEGGTTTTSGTVLVGERGPEFLNLPRGASVVPLDRATSGGSGETIINIELNNVRMSSQDDIRELASQISEFINDERRRA